MHSSSVHSNNAIPTEYRDGAEKLFPQGGFTSKKGLSLKAIGEFANTLGIGAEFRRLLPIHKSPGTELNTYLENFQYNLDLLIQKTWVEKADEARKEILLDEVPGFVDRILKKNFRQALDEFGAILDELAYLFFGAQSMRDDFTEYTFRIDAQMGLFWWYGSQLGRLKDFIKDHPADDEALWAVLLLGICFLTNF